MSSRNLHLERPGLKKDTQNWTVRLTSQSAPINDWDYFACMVQMGHGIFMEKTMWPRKETERYLKKKIKEKSPKGECWWEITIDAKKLRGGRVFLKFFAKESRYMYQDSLKLAAVPRPLPPAWWDDREAPLNPTKRRHSSYREVLIMIIKLQEGHINKGQ